MLKESVSVTTGNDRYEGFGIDIIQEMSKILGFNYTFEVQVDKAYGSFNNITKKWDGMLGKIIAGVSRNILPRINFIPYEPYIDSTSRVVLLPFTVYTMREQRVAASYIDKAVASSQICR